MTKINPYKVSIDFDGTLTRPDVQAFVKELLKYNVEVWICTSRYDLAHIHLYKGELSRLLPHDDVYELVNNLGIDITKIRFNNMTFKSSWLKNSTIMFHIDDDILEIEKIKEETTVGAIYVEDDNWKDQCLEILKKQEINI